MYPFLYKYCKFSEKNYDLSNFQNDTLFFNSPTGYNDPYEGVIAVSITDIIKAYFIARSETYNLNKLDIDAVFALPEIIQSIEGSKDIKSVDRNYLIYSEKQLQILKSPRSSLLF